MEGFIEYMTLPNQVRLPYIEQGDKAGIPLILLHGYADTLHTFELILPLLPESIHTLALTQRGYGDSSGLDIGYETKDFVSDLLMFMDALHIEKAVIAGASSGGFIARRFAAYHPERTMGLVLLGTPGTLGNNPQVRATMELTISKLTDPVDPEFIRDFTQNTIKQPVPEEFLERIIQATKLIPAKGWREAGQGLLEEELPGELDKIFVPTLIIWGDQDPILPRNDQEALAQAIKGSRLLVHPGLGHMLYWEAPALIAADLVAFVKSIAYSKFGHSIIDESHERQCR